MRSPAIMAAFTRFMLALLAACLYSQPMPVRAVDLDYPPEGIIREFGLR